MHQVYKFETAQAIAKEMEDDEWTYKVIRNPLNKKMAVVAAIDENGEFVGYL